MYVDYRQVLSFLRLTIPKLCVMADPVAYLLGAITSVHLSGTHLSIWSIGTRKGIFFSR